MAQHATLAARLEEFVASFQSPRGGNLFVAKPGDVSTWGFTCGVTADDETVVCWSDNRHGELGNGSRIRALMPMSISNP
jgi:hypothetical protein